VEILAILCRRVPDTHRIGGDRRQISRGVSHCL
jgi:hypothetical protein